MFRLVIGSSVATLRTAGVNQSEAFSWFILSTSSAVLMIGHDIGAKCVCALLLVRRVATGLLAH